MKRDEQSRVHSACVAAIGDLKYYESPKTKGSITWDECIVHLTDKYFLCFDLSATIYLDYGNYKKSFTRDEPW